MGNTLAGEKQFSPFEISLPGCCYTHREKTHRWQTIIDGLGVKSFSPRAV